MSTISSQKPEHPIVHPGNNPLPEDHVLSEPLTGMDEPNDDDSSSSSRHPLMGVTVAVQLPNRGGSTQQTTQAAPKPIDPEVARRRARLEERLGITGSRIGPNGLLGIVGELVGDGLKADRFQLQWRASGLSRPGVIVQLTWPRLATRVGISIEPILAHALVDRLLGFERLPAEGRAQVTPVEWGILSFVAARALERLDANPGPLGPWDLTIDHVGPDPFDDSGLGPIVTWKWRLRVGKVTGSARVWVPESVVSLWLLDEQFGGKARPVINRARSALD